MDAHSTVIDLARKLAQSGHGGLLARRLDALPDDSDPDATALFADMLESGVADTLGEALAAGRLDRWVRDTCTQREEEALARQLAAWLGRGTRGDDDPARLVCVPAPPDTEDELLLWAREHGSMAELASDASEVLPSGQALGRFTTLLDCALGRVQGGPTPASLLEQVDVSKEALRHLHEAAERRAARKFRATLWETRPPKGLLRTLVERLHGVLRDTPLVTLEAHPFVPARPVTLDVSSGRAEGSLLSREGEVLSVRLRLSGYEQRALDGSCSGCRAQPCDHVRALSARLLDAALLPDDRLHPALVALTAEPSWKRFVRRVAHHEPTVTPRPEGKLGFRLERTAERLKVGVMLHKPMPSGGLSKGKLIAAARALHTPFCTDVDRPVLEAMCLGGRGTSGQPVPADLALLRALSEHPAVAWLDGEDVRLAERPLRFELREQPEGLEPRLSLAGKAIAPAGVALDVPYLIEHEPSTRTLWFAPLSPQLKQLIRALEDFRGLLPTESFAELSPWLASLRQVAEVSAPEALSGQEIAAPKQLLLRIVPTVQEGIDVRLCMRALPLGALWPPGQGPARVHGLVEGKQVYARRDLDRERLSAMHLLDTLELHTFPQLEPFCYRIEDPQDALELLSKAARATDELTLEWSERARRMSFSPPIRHADLSIQLFKRGRWLELQGGAKSGEVPVPVSTLLSAARRGERFVRIEGNDYAEIERELFERLEAAQRGLDALDARALRKLCRSSAPWLERTLRGGFEAGDEPSATFLADALDRSRGAAIELDPRWQALLRPYQADGARWLMWMARWAPGACLADEMGLGKTLQALCLLDARQALGPALVVAPTSVASQWVDELARFSSERDVRHYQGKTRENALIDAGPGVVVVTSYDLLQRDFARFEGIHFATQVLDEAQWIKNARTQRAESATGIDADFRVALSGTPIENRLGDLWSLFHAIAPGLLGSWSRFRARFAVPIERYQDEARMAALRDIVSPFMLRRTKDDVEKELPLRTEIIHRIELSHAERDLYAAAVVEARRALGKRKRHEASRTIQILAELTRLRQLACHPRLVLKESDVGSTKLRTLLTLLDDILPRGHRVLVFSQFTSHLSLVREALRERGREPLYLDGQTPAAERSRLVARFQAGEEAVFLISLKAGGAGLNLTAADYVVHLDPWWNPAAEDQASDRAHRIGQTRPVTVVKLVSEDTIEEKVVALHAHKRELAEAIVSDQASATPLDEQTLELLLGA